MLKAIPPISTSNFYHLRTFVKESLKSFGSFFLTPCIYTKVLLLNFYHDEKEIDLIYVCI